MLTNRRSTRTNPSTVVYGKSYQCTVHLAFALSTHSIHRSFATMASPKHHCPCYKCKSSGRKLALRTIRIHFKNNQAHLDHLRASGAQRDDVNFVQDCQDQISQLLYSLDQRSQSSVQSRSPYPDSEYSLFILLITY